MMGPQDTINRFMPIKILTILVLLGISISCTNSGSDTDGSSSAFGATQGISGVITGDIVANVRIDLEKPDGTPVFTAITGSDGSYLFPGSQLVEGDYVVIPDKDNTQFVPDRTSITYVRSGVNRVDFGALFAFPETVLSSKLNMVGTPLDVISTVGGNVMYVSLHPINQATENVNDVNLLTSRFPLIYGYRTDQDGTSSVKYTSTRKDMTIQMIPSSDGHYIYALNINNGGQFNNVIAYGLDASDGIHETGRYDFDAGFVPNHMALSPNGKILYASCKDENRVVAISAPNMIYGASISVSTPISITATNDELYILSEPIDNGIVMQTGLTRINAVFTSNRAATTIANFKAKKIIMGLTEQKFYVMSEASSNNGGSILQYNLNLTKLSTEISFNANNTPTNMIITPNNREMYVTVDTQTAFGNVAIIDLDTFTLKKTIAGLGRKPVGMGIALDLSPTHLLGMVINAGDTTISIMK